MSINELATEMSINELATPSISHFTIKGSKTWNEDYSYSETIETKNEKMPWVSILIVADGHGMNGEGLDCATFCGQGARDWISELLKSNSNWSLINWKQSATELTSRLHDEYRQVCAQKNKRVIEKGIVKEGNRGDDAVHSGTTFSMAIVFPNEGQFRTVSIQVGDSDILINGKILDCDHTPLNPSEFQRIQALPQRMKFVYDINRFNRPDIFLADGTFDPTYCNLQEENNKKRWKWNHGIRPCCAKYSPSIYAISDPEYPFLTCISMTRSIGDFYAHIIGMSTEPDVRVHDTDSIPMVMIASDGVWDSCDENNQWFSPTRQMVCSMESFSNRSAEEYGMLIRGVATELFGIKGLDDISLAILNP